MMACHFVSYPFIHDNNNLYAIYMPNQGKALYRHGLLPGRQAGMTQIQQETVNIMIVVVKIPLKCFFNLFFIQVTLHLFRPLISAFDTYAFGR